MTRSDGQGDWILITGKDRHCQEIDRIGCLNLFQQKPCFEDFVKIPIERKKSQRNISTISIQYNTGYLGR